MCENNQYYYLDRSGARLQNTKKIIGGKTYKFEKNGVCKKKTRAERKAAQTADTETMTETTKM